MRLEVVRFSFALPLSAAFLSLSSSYLCIVQAIVIFFYIAATESYWLRLWRTQHPEACCTTCDRSNATDCNACILRDHRLCPYILIFFLHNYSSPDNIVNWLTVIQYSITRGVKLTFNIPNIDLQTWSSIKHYYTDSDWCWGHYWKLFPRCLENIARRQRRRVIFPKLRGNNFQ